MIFIIFFVTLFFTTWLNVKFSNDASGRDQYWHIVQMYQQAWYYISYMFVMFLFGRNFEFIWHNFLIPLIAWACMYMFLYNSFLNALWKLKISYLGSYDRFKFSTTVKLFIVGLIITILSIMKVI
jgi:hypothetical protein